jgi:hypothetical protein
MLGCLGGYAGLASWWWRVSELAGWSSMLRCRPLWSPTSAQLRGRYGAPRGLAVQADAGLAVQADALRARMTRGFPHLPNCGADLGHPG